MRPSKCRIVAWAGIASLLLLLGGGCGGSSEAPGREPSVQIKERDFKIRAPKQIAAGPVRFAVDNRGPVMHELLVAHATGAKLPIDPDGINVDEEGLEPRLVDELEPEEPGVHTLRLNLRPGRYVLLCNMSGHFKGGMHTEVTVR